MYQNKVNLIGFLGNDAEIRTNNNRSITTLSLATKSSYKKDVLLDDLVVGLQCSSRDLHSV